jgi:hypothetical protein
VSRGVVGLAFLAGILALAASAVAQTVQEVRVRWTTSTPPPPGTSAERIGPAAAQLFSVINRQTRTGRLRRQREPELNSDQMVIIARDSNGKMLDWQIVPDPRVIRAEAPGPGGQLSGQTFYLGRADFLFTLPSDPDITRIDFYRPRWTGAYFDLDLIGAAPLR